MTTSRRLAALALGALTTSLGAQAQDRAQDKPAESKAKEKPRARTYTDEDLKKYKAPPGASSPASASPSSTQTQAPSPNPRQRRPREDGISDERSEHPRSEPIDPPEAATDASSSGPPAAERSPEETAWRGRAAQAHRPLENARGRVAGIDAQIAELRDKLNPMSTNYVLGGNSTAGPGQVYEIEDQLRGLGEERAQAQADLTEAQKAWERFLEEARAAGAPPGWLIP